MTIGLLRSTKSKVGNLIRTWIGLSYFTFLISNLGLFPVDEEAASTLSISMSVVFDIRM